MLKPPSNDPVAGPQGRATAQEAKVIVSAGHKNFHLLFSAAEMAQRGRLAMLITGAVPRPWEKAVLQSPPFSAIRQLGRFLNREEKVPAALIRQSRLSEMFSDVAIALRKRGGSKARDAVLQARALRLYGRKAAQHLRKLPDTAAGVYHYRAGFGQSSVAVAKAKGLRTLCDHSIVHPALLELLVEGKGQFPETVPARPGGFWGTILDDIDAADDVLVNSDFVAETFVFMGFDRSRIKVAYQGVEDKFMARLPATRSYRTAGTSEPVKLLYAGGVTERKGMAVLQQVLQDNPDLPVALSIAGAVRAENERRFATLLNDPRVTYHGMLSQNALATLMSTSDVFVFPTFAEGSARVIFEAMAAGCAVVTTPNGGSVLEDQKGGYLIPPGDAAALQAALIGLTDTNAPIAEMGRYNHALIRSAYSQAHYGDQLEKAYDS